jgi:hypothetical protein
MDNKGFLKRHFEHPKKPEIEDEQEKGGQDENIVDLEEKKHELIDKKLGAAKGTSKLAEKAWREEKIEPGKWPDEQDKTSDQK